MKAFSQSAQPISISAPIAFINRRPPPFPFRSRAPPPKPPPAHDMEHMQHSHGGLMQEGMRHAVARGIKIEQQVDSASHTITLREGPMTLPARTSHMKMPQPPDLFWSIPIDGWLLAYAPHLVDARGNAVPGTVRSEQHTSELQSHLNLV